MVFNGSVNRFTEPFFFCFPAARDPASLDRSLRGNALWAARTVFYRPVLGLKQQWESKTQNLIPFPCRRHVSTCEMHPLKNRF